MKSLSLEWSSARIDEIASVKTGPFGSALHEADYALTGTPIVTVEHLGERGIQHTNLPLVGHEDVRRLSAYICRPGDILFSRVGSIDRNSLVSDSEDGWLFSGRLLRVRTDTRRVHAPFLSYVFSTTEFKDSVRAVAVGQTMPSLNTKLLGALRVSFPDLAQQRTSAEALGDADKLISSIERLIAKKHAVKQGMMQQLLTGQIRLPGFASNWSDIRLGDHVSYVKTAALSRAELDADSSLRYLHYGDIHTNSNVRVDAASDEMPRVSASKVRNAGRLQIGDLVFADASEDPAGVGKSVEVMSVPVGGVVPGLHTIAARFDKAVLADGFKAYLQFIPNFRDSLLRLASGTKVLATTRTYISSVVISLPGADEQRAIAVILRDADAEIAAIEHQLANVLNIKHGMMQELLTGHTCLKPAEVAA